MRDPGRSEYSFVPHKYIHSTPILSPTPGGMDFDIGTADETTPINARQHAVEHARPTSVHYSAFMYWFILIVPLSFVCVEWVLLYPLSPSRLYNNQVDMFDGRVNLAEFFFLQILPLGMLLGSLITFKLADRLGRATMLELAVIVGLPILLAEVSDDDYRGRDLTASQLFCMLGGHMVYIGIGQFFVYLSTCYVSFNLNEWKIIATMGVAPCLLLLVCMQFVPDTPSWLLLRHNDRITSFSVYLKIQSPVNRSTRAEVRVNSNLHADFLSCFLTAKSNDNQLIYNLLDIWIGETKREWNMRRESKKPTRVHRHHRRVIDVNGGDKLWRHPHDASWGLDRVEHAYQE
ncbi:hypothetical protein DYB25_012866 [Aphanomyces astaci]|uniref:Major facilitator superfamily (MFS) profile domain-containing protein n=1 Tax=Aphanomyces astaci TaxID=112090 RepID=A0A397DCL8_APHAT|nr:hypothetical protein DYB25_012866 [Aphanomyces astaci]RHY59646.1 hypothetical protein DYB30_013195 [Aphanomyces astaci]RHZ01674.1 hypothetical protein DYB31_014097 [Aphanomyces astaci]